MVEVEYQHFFGVRPQELPRPKQFPSDLTGQLTVHEVEALILGSPEHAEVKVADAGPQLVVQGRCLSAGPFGGDGKSGWSQATQQFVCVVVAGQRRLGRDAVRTRIVASYGRRRAEKGMNSQVKSVSSVLLRHDRA